MKNIKSTKNGVLISDTKNFEPEKIFTCGQCFRWNVYGEDKFRGVVGDKVLKVSRKGNDILLEGTDLDEYTKVWHKYFDMERDYSKIITFLSDDPVIFPAVLYGEGIRILKQDFFECVISFIISANNNIPRIQGIIEKLCGLFGKKIPHYDGDYYSFPSSADMKGVTEEMLSPLKCGYRAKYIAKTINAFNDGQIDKELIESLPYEDAKRELCKISGVGPKVADCILLFSMGRFDVFPTDVWVKRIMSELYGCSENEVAKIGRQFYGDYAGIAQQFLFFFRRSTDKKVNAK